MSRSRTRSKSALALLVLSGLAAACGTGDGETGGAGAASATDEQSNAAATLREADFPAYTTTRDAFIDIGKRLVGIDPQAPLGQISYYGLQNLADELGYGWTWNSCGTNWDVATPAGAVVLTSNHQTGSGYSCDDGPKRDDPAKYTFADWVIDGSSRAVKQPYSAADAAAVAQASTGTAQVSLNAEGEIAIAEATVVEADTGLNPTSGKVTLALGVDQAITLSKTLERGWSNSEEAGISVEASVTAGLPGVESATVKTAFSFKYTRQDNGKTATTTTTTVTPKCSFTVDVGPGCHLKGSITVSRVKRAARYTAYINAKPRTATISGFMRYGDSHGCMRRGNKKGGGRDVDGHCDRKHVDQLFGTAENGPTFVQDILAQRMNDSGDWYWHLMSGIADYQHGGSADVDLTIGNLTSERPYQFSLPFTTSEEDVTDCKINLAVAKDSAASCAAPPPSAAPAK